MGLTLLKFCPKLSRDSTNDRLPPYLRHVHSMHTRSKIWFSGKYEINLLFPPSSIPKGL